MEIIVDATASGQRFDRFLRKWFKKYPQMHLSDIYRSIRTGGIKVNNKKVKEQYRLQEGDVVQIDEHVPVGEEDLSLLMSQKERKIQAINHDIIKHMLLYEDDYWIVFDKPAGVLVHPGNKHRNELSMNDYLEVYTQSYVTDIFKPSFGYRLDKDTSGVLIGAKTYEALQYINQIIRERKIDKEYLTIVIGKFPKHLIIDKPLTRFYDKKFDRSHVKVDYRDGLTSKTECWLEKVFSHPLLGELSLVRIKIHTGRMHQIRVHLSHEGYPVLGDIIYGKPAANRVLYKSLRINRQLLHCWKYGFYDPFQNKDVYFESPLPSDFRHLFGEKK